MHKKSIFSRAKAYRLWVERLEKRSMLAADVDAGFDDFSFDWSQFDDAAWADWSQFDDSAWSDPAVDLAIADDSFVDQQAEGDLSWMFEQDGADPAPAEPEAPLPEAVTDDPTATPDDVWQTNVVDATDSSGTDPIATDTTADDTTADDTTADDTTADDTTADDTTADDTTADDTTADDTTADTEIVAVTAVEPPVMEDPVAETVTDPPLPVEPEPTTAESPFPSDPSIPEADGNGWVEEGHDDIHDWSGWSDWSDWSDETDAAELEAGVVDEMQPQDGDEPLPEDVVSFDPDRPVQTAVPPANATANANGPRQTGFSARAAAFGAMRMFPGFSFGGSTDSSDDGPIFAGGRRRSRR